MTKTDFSVRDMREIVASLPMLNSVKGALLAGAEALMRAEILLRRVESEGLSSGIPETIAAFNAERRKVSQ